MQRRNLQEISWLGGSREIVRGFSKPVRVRIGNELFRLQIGLDPKDWKPMTRIGAGVREIRVSSGGQFRVIYVLHRSEGIVILRVFQKKARQTRKADIEISRRRLKQLESDRGNARKANG